MGRISPFVLLSVAFATTVTASAKPPTRADYVIVGGGPAGLVLAEQLSRDRGKSIVLLEAGIDAIDDAKVNTPAMYPLITEHYWNYTAEPSPSLNGNAIAIAQGRVFGGGTAVNGMAYCRGASSVFDEWAERSGNDGLAWPSFLDDFKATAHYRHQHANYSQVTNRTVYGRGPLEVSQVGGLTGFDVPFATATMDALDLEEVDLTDGTGIGLDYGLSSIEAGERERSYARSTFGKMIQRRKNVQMISGAWVHRVGFEGTTAVNVTYLDTARGNKTLTVGAKEVIVSGGAINTPKLLMLSGIGPKESLSKLKIPVVADLPAVGRKMYDHPFSILSLEVTPDIKTFWQWSENETAHAIATADYKRDRSGPLGWNNGYAYAAYRLPDSAWKDAGVDGSHYTSLPKDRPHVLIEYSTVPFMAEAAGFSSVTAWASLVQPEAAGSVSLRSADYRDNPVIHSNYYGSEADKVAIQHSWKQLREILKDDRVQPYVVKEFFPGPEVTSDEEIWSAIQSQTYSFRHPVGTVPLGEALEKDWRIKGLKGIRVVDSSTFPFPSTCHPQATVYALAHRAARDIKAADRG